MTEKYVVSYWHIPGGWDFSNATACEIEFPTKEEADGFAERCDRSEMPFVFKRDCLCS